MSIYYPQTLSEIWHFLKAEGHGSDKGDVHSYIEIYEDILKPYRTTAKNILEIGLLNGDSLRMWDRYFWGTVYGIDCDEKPVDGLGDLWPIIKEAKYNIFIGNAEDPGTIEKFFKGIKFDVIIEDANHSIEQQIKLYNNFKPYMAEGGIYIIEDIQDIYATREQLENIDPEKTVEIMDLRHIKERYDDVMVIIK